MPRGIVRQLRRVRKTIDAEISVFASQGFYAAGLASEGYQGGYRDALDDVLLALAGANPQRRNWWPVAGWAEKP